jgi:hypothetical protein
MAYTETGIRHFIAFIHTTRYGRFAESIGDADGDLAESYIKLYISENTIVV